jgi:Ca2+-binding RTX toxin-like protein
MATYKGTTGNDDIFAIFDTVNDTFDVWPGGDDTVQAGSGNDLFVFRGAFTAADSIDGGAGGDILRLNGDYSAGVAFTNSTMVNVETIQLGAGHDYDLTTADGNVAAGATLTVNARHVAGTVTFDGSAETDGHFKIIAGASAETLTGGGGGGDLFVLGGVFTAADSIDGGAGNDVLRLSGDYSAGATLTDSTMVNIEKIQLGAGHDYDLTTADANVAKGATLTVDASKVAGNVTFDGSAEIAGGFKFIAGSGGETLTGDGSNDRFIFGANFNANDALNGGGGNDVLEFTATHNEIDLSPATITNVETLILESAGTAGVTTIVTDATIAAGATMLVAGNRLGAGEGLAFDGSAESDGHFILRGGAGNDVLTGGALSDTFNIVAGGTSQTDAVHGGGGDDVIDVGANWNSNTTIDGGNGNDTVVMNGDYAAPGLFLGEHTPLNISTKDVGGNLVATSVETIALEGNHIYVLDLVLGDLTVDASLATGLVQALMGSGNLTFIGGAGTYVTSASDSSTANSFTFNGSSVAVATGNSGTDSFTLNGDHIDAVIDGGGGNDTVNLNGNYDGLAFGTSGDPIQRIDNLNIQGGHGTETITLAGTPSDSGTLTVNANLVPGDSLTLDASGLTQGLDVEDPDGFGGSATIIDPNEVTTADASAFNSVSVTGGTASETIILNHVPANLVYGSAQDSTLSAMDRLIIPDLDSITFDFTFHGGTAMIDAAVTTGAVNGATMAADFAAALGADELDVNGVLLFSPNGGNEVGNVYLVVNTTGVAGYSAGDMVFLLDVPAGSLHAANFEFTGGSSTAS